MSNYLDIYNAVEKGDLDEVAKLLEIDPSLVNCDRDGYGDTPLVEAASKGDCAIAEYLLNHGADIHASDEYWHTPLIASVEDQHIDMIELLIARGADVNGADSPHQAPLHIACERNLIDIALLLIKNGSDINGRDSHGITPLHAALDIPCETSLLTIEMLLKNGAEINAGTNEKSVSYYEAFGQTPLHIAVNANKKMEIVKFLLSNGADLNAKDSNGDTPLDIAEKADKAFSVTENILASVIKSNRAMKEIAKLKMIKGNPVCIFYKQRVSVPAKFLVDTIKDEWNRKTVLTLLRKLAIE